MLDSATGDTPLSLGSPSTSEAPCDDRESWVRAQLRRYMAARALEQIDFHGELRHWSPRHNEVIDRILDNARFDPPQCHSESPTLPD